MNNNEFIANTAESLIVDLQGAISEAGKENVAVVIRHVSDNEFGPEDNLSDFYVFYDENEDKVVIKVRN